VREAAEHVQRGGQDRGRGVVEEEVDLSKGCHDKVVIDERGHNHDVLLTPCTSLLLDGLDLGRRSLSAQLSVRCPDLRRSWTRISQSLSQHFVSLHICLAWESHRILCDVSLRCSHRSTRLQEWELAVDCIQIQ
jgi:hypothetical protein